ncbi:MarR family transcriptional regulator [Streptomyces hydrogenans]|uniref:MarR family transcriptional regulator n=1 Tax=Streptomyces TaxID=1883 RepID=UPI00202EADE5|nr:helix-turn-helix domain-containing protein [Streptomyces sp. G2]MCM1948970.1 winged helix-turn-helix domain-containing protein [Streptomyces sp. G2]
MGENGSGQSGWTFLTNHARVLLTVARDPEMRLRDVAVRCGVTERTVQAIVADLEQGGYLARARAADGRRNRYRVNPDAPFRHPAEAGHEIAGLLELLARADDREPGRTPDPSSAVDEGADA